MMDLLYSNNVEALREERNIKKAQMARDLDISRKCILKIELGEQNVSLDMAYRIAAYFERDIKEVFPLIQANNDSMKGVT